MSLRAGIEVVSNTEISIFLQCARKWYFSYGLKRAPRIKRDALTKGLKVHKVVGALHRGEAMPYLEGEPALRALLRGYRMWWGSTQPNGAYQDNTFRCDRTDVRFQVELDGIFIVGEFDGVGSNSGTPALIEHKSSSEDITPGSSYWQKVALTDRQVSIYLAAAASLKLGQTEVLYDVLGKPKLRLKKDESEEDFEIRVLEAIMESPEKYYQRATIVRLEHEHEDHMRDIRGVVHLMQATRQAGTYPRNVDSCFKYGAPCEFYAVCGTGVDIMNDAYYGPKRESGVRENPYVF
jgi:hypothetical protein